MAFIREKTEERTGYQLGDAYTERVDNQCDFVMCYRINESMEERIKTFREKGYVVHLMTGISWGAYLDYLEGEYDGRKHWDEAQTDRYGNQILHGKNVPYMVPTVSFADYLTEKLKKAVDAGVVAIHVEEPEFWDRAGYSEAFKREYFLYYRAPWQPPHESADAKYKCSKLKAYLFTRTIDRISSSLKEYAMTKYGRELRFYVPTHSLVNYTQWKIVSPEGKLADIPGVDGCIAQVWTGTSRTKNWFDGKFAERTFETAYLEYGVMQELVKGTGRKMWFLHDPIEDNPIFDWNDYRKNYYCTVSASLLHPKVNTYEICPWPNRVFYEKYPKSEPNAEPIPEEYATLLNNMFQTLGALEGGKKNDIEVGILTGDCQLYQREYPDCEFSEPPKEEVGTVLVDTDELTDKISAMMKADKPEKETMLKYMASGAFPGFYSLALPLLKYGVSVRPVLLDNARRYTGYLDDYNTLILSYEFMKPDYPDMNNAIAQWVMQGGTLFYVGDGKDPFNNIDLWWNGKYNNPAEHLFEMLGIKPEKEKEIFRCGKGIVAVWNTNPCYFSFSKEKAETLRKFFTEIVKKSGSEITFKNYLSIERDPYIIAAVIDESINDNPLKLSGNFIDMYSPKFDFITDKTVNVGESTMLLDLDKIKYEKLCIIGTSVRVYSLDEVDGKIILNVQGAGEFTAHIRIKVPHEVTKAEIDDKEIECIFDRESGTALVTFESVVGPRKIVIE